MKKKQQCRKYKQHRNKRRSRVRTILKVLIASIVIAAVCFGIKEWNHQRIVKSLSETETPEWVDVQLIDADGVSRNGKRLDAVKDIVIHYVGNPGSTAQQNRDFYNGSQSTVSSHFVVGLEGEVIQCLPLDEESAASNWRNNDTISIEVCHPDDTGKFNSKTYKSLVKLTAWLEIQCGLNEEHIIRHYDITGKECPRYFVQHKDKWEEFKEDVANYRR